MNILYSTQATAIGGRGGWVGSDDGALKIKLSTPEALGGAGGPGSNPEQLFAAAYSACFLDAVRAAAAELDIEITDDANVTTTIAVGRRDEASKLGLRVGLSVDLAGLDPEKAEALIERADALCLISNALRGGVSGRIHVS